MERSGVVEGGTEWPSIRPELTVQIEKEVHAEMKSNCLDMAENQKLRPIQKAFVHAATFEMRGSLLPSTLKQMF